MKIGTIGAGQIGGNLTRRHTTLGHEVSVANSHGPRTLGALAEETGTPVYGLSSSVDDVRRALDAASPERTAAWRA